MWFVGIDPGLQNIGVAFWPEDSTQGTPELHRIRPPAKYNKSGSPARLDYIRQELDIVCFRMRGLGAAALTAIELPVWGKQRSGNQHAMGEGSGIIRLAVWKHLGEQIRVLPAVWKLELLGSGKSETNKAPAIELARSELLKTAWKEAEISEHEAEALLLAMYAQRYFHKTLKNPAPDSVERHAGKPG